MHLLSLYSLTAGAEIRKPFIQTKYFPLPGNITKYIVFQPKSQYDSKNFSYWQETLDLIKPYLQKEGIEIIQIGDKNDTPINGTYYISGQTNIGQAAYLINNALLVLSADSFSVHIASAYQKKIVALYSNNYCNNVNGFWSKKEDVRYFEPDRTKLKPSFSATENPKTIDTINVEKIAAAVLDLLNIKFEYSYETKLIGMDFNKRLLEMIPDTPINPSNLGIENMIVRLDLDHNIDVLIKQLQVIKCSLIFNKPIPLDLLKQFKSQITQLAYILDQNHDPKYADELKKLAIPYVLLCKETPEWLNNIKLNYLDNKLILPINSRDNKDQIDELKEIPLEKLYYKSNKFVLGRGKIYPSAAAWQEDKPISNLMPQIQPLINNRLFFEEINNFLILQKLND